MSDFSVVIPSRSPAQLVTYLRAILEHEPNLTPSDIIIVWDGSDGDVAPAADLPVGIRLIAVDKPFVFARNVNLGIRAARRDCIIVNDDALLITEAGFSGLAQLAAAEGFGVLSAGVSGSIGNPLQASVPVGGFFRQIPDTLMFVCVYLPWATWRRVGELDERFTGYGFEDNDYCQRVRDAGLRLGVFDGCVVDHGDGSASYRQRPNLDQLWADNKRLFAEKYAARARLSFAMIALDEERFIGDCLRSVQDVVAEMVVYKDACTSDGTAAIACEYGAKVFNGHLRADLDGFGLVRSCAAMACVRTDSVLMLDADERLTQAGRAMLPRCLSYMPDQVDGWGFTIEDRTLDDKPFAEVGTVPRLFVRDPQLRFEGYCHEDLVWSDPRKVLRTGHVTDAPAIVHYGHDPSLQAERGKHERHIELLRRWLSEHPNDAPRWLSLAEELFELRRYGEAKRMAGRALATGYRFPPHRLARIDQIRTAR